MSTFVLPITKKGTVTIPKKIREFLGVFAGSGNSKVVIVLNEDEKTVTVSRPAVSIQELTKSIKPRKPDIEEKYQKEALDEERAEKYLKSSTL
jgi:bifunctional DNA-binding transcriptional regulator/antitoxin component of YhaV-PrlF toxin-antitoxin module